MSRKRFVSRLMKNGRKSIRINPIHFDSIRINPKQVFTSKQFEPSFQSESFRPRIYSNRFGMIEFENLLQSQARFESD